VPIERWITWDRHGLCAVSSVPLYLRYYRARRRSAEAKFAHPSDSYLDLIIARRDGFFDTAGLLLRYLVGAERGSALYEHVKVRLARWAGASSIELNGRSGADALCGVISVWP
jgi:hypothetical protein